MGYVVYRFVATDNDMGSNGAVVYSLEELAPTGGMVSLTTLTYVNVLMCGEISCTWHS